MHRPGSITLALSALSALALTGASAQASTGDLAKQLRKLDPGARLGGESIVGTRPGQQLHGVHGRPNFIVALGDGETIHGASINDQLGAAPHAQDVKIIAPAKGHSLIVGGPGSRIVVSGKGHNLIYSHAAGATIVLESPGNEVIADGPHDRIVCADHASHELIEVAKGVRVSKSCKGHHNEIEPAPAPLSARSAAASEASSATVLGSGTNEDPYMPDRCDEIGPRLTCIVRFPARTLRGFWANEHVPAYECPVTDRYLVDIDYAPAGTQLPPGVEVQVLGPIGVTIDGVSSHGRSYGGIPYAAGTLTGFGNSSATNWTFGDAAYSIVFHCSFYPGNGYQVSDG
jgi:hypothetical protein